MVLSLTTTKKKNSIAFSKVTWNIIWLNSAKWFKEWNILMTWIFLLTKGFQLKSNMINIKKFVLLIQNLNLIQVTLLAFHVMSQVLIINNNNHCTESKFQKIKLNGGDKLELACLLAFLLSLSVIWVYL